MGRSLGLMDWEALAWIHPDSHPGAGRGVYLLWNSWLPGTWGTSELGWDYRLEWLLAWHPWCQIIAHARSLSCHRVPVNVWEGDTKRALRQAGFVFSPDTWRWKPTTFMAGQLRVIGLHQFTPGRELAGGLEGPAYLWAQPREDRRAAKSDHHPAETDGSGRGLWRPSPTFSHSAIQLTFTEDLLGATNHVPRCDSLRAISPEPALRDFTLARERSWTPGYSA